MIRMYERPYGRRRSLRLTSPIMNQETICGGTELGLQSYPTFNSPYEILDAVANAGFDWLSTSSNHSMDVGEAGHPESAGSSWKNCRGLTQTGTNASADEAKEYIVIMNKNGAAHRFVKLYVRAQRLCAAGGKRIPGRSDR